MKEKSLAVNVSCIDKTRPDEFKIASCESSNQCTMSPDIVTGDDWLLELNSVSTTPNQYPGVAADLAVIGPMANEPSSEDITEL